MISIGVSFIFCFYSFFYNEVSFIDVQTSPTQLFRIYYYKFSDFAESPFGKVIVCNIYFLRDFLMIMLEFGLNGWLVYLFKYFIIKKTKLIFTVSPKSRRQSNVNVNQQDPNIVGNRKFSLPPVEIKNILKADGRITLMVLAICFLSSFEHVFWLFSRVYFSFFNSKVADIIYVFSDFGVVFKHFLNFFLIFIFNAKFRTELKFLLRI